MSGEIVQAKNVKIGDILVGANGGIREIIDVDTERTVVQKLQLYDNDTISVSETQKIKMCFYPHQPKLEHVNSRYKLIYHTLRGGTKISSFKDAEFDKAFESYQKLDDVDRVAFLSLNDLEKLGQFQKQRQYKILQAFPITDMRELDENPYTLGLTLTENTKNANVDEKMINHIPSRCILDSPADRLLLIAGIIDGGGRASRKSYIISKFAGHEKLYQLCNITGLRCQIRANDIVIYGSYVSQIPTLKVTLSENNLSEISNTQVIPFIVNKLAAPWCKISTVCTFKFKEGNDCILANGIVLTNIR